jgi:uncharacterized protein YjdB
MKRRSAVLCGISILLLIYGGCGGSPTSPTLSGTALTIIGTASFTRIGETSQLTAIERLSDGTDQDVTNQTSWESSNPAVFTVSATGLVTATSVGEAAIRASYWGKTGALSVSVLVAPVVSIAIVPDTNLLKLGQMQQFSLSVELGPGIPLSGGPLPRWSSTNPSVIMVDGGGAVTGIGVGESVIEVLYKGKTAARQLTVVP